MPLPKMPPIPFFPYLVLESNSLISIFLSRSVRDILTAITAGSKACIFTLLGLEAKLAPLLIKSS